jgi:peptidoglycan/LPS O-acetylase OafA/YrhL
MTTRLTSPLPTNNFDFLRFAFASLVVLSHSYPLASGSEAREPLMLATRGQLTLGTLAVDCFFIISGFLILHSWLAQPDPLRYLTKRVMRIYPAFLIVATLDAFVVAPVFSTAGYQLVDPQFVARFVLNALRLEALTPGPSFQTNPASGTVNGSLWSISYEFWCYIGVLVLGIAGYAAARKPLAWALLASLAVSFVFQWKHLTPGGRLLGQIFGFPPFWARLLPFFLVGMAFYAYRDKVRLNGLGALAAAAALVAAVWIPYGLVFVLPLAAAYLIFWFAFLPLPRLARFAKGGDFSYGIYLYSFPLLQIVAYCWGGPMASPVLFLIGWPVALLFAFFSWHLVEKHCIRLAKTRAPVRAAPVARAT